MVSDFNFSEFVGAFTGWFVDMYSYTTSIYPFSDVNISLFWILESSVIWQLAWKFFPVEMDEQYHKDDDYLDESYIV